MNGPKAKRWSPWAVGAAIGALSVFAFATVDRGLGITTPFEQGAALTERAVAPNSAPVAEYFAAKPQPKIDWEWTLVLGVFLGSLLSSKLSKDRDEPQVPPLWAQRFGGSFGKRLAGAFAGGAVMMFGARLAQGCTSGHGITGTLQLAVSSWIFIVLAMATGVVVALTLYGRRPDHVRRA